MTRAHAVLVRRSTWDGLMFLETDDPMAVGDRMFVDVDNMVTRELYNVAVGVFHTKVMIAAFDLDMKPLGLMPVETIQVLGE